MSEDTSTMTADTATTAPATPNGETAPKKNGNGHKVSHVIPFSKIEVSKWNRSCGITPDDEYIEDLASDIKKNGLLHPITLVKTAEDDGYRIVAGANRVGALRKLRGAESGLTQAEFKVRDDMDEEDSKCLQLSLSENHHRRTSSVYETAVYVKRLIEDQKIDQGKVGHMLDLTRSKVNRLLKLVKEFDNLPDNWMDDLNTSPSSAGAKNVVVTFTHWYEVAGQIKNGEITGEIADVLIDAHKKKWSTRELRAALKKVIAGNAVPNGAGEAAGGKAQASKGKPTLKAGPLVVLKNVVVQLRATAEAMKPDRAGDAGELVRFADAVETIVTKLEAEKAAAKGKSKKGKKGKGAEAQNATAQAA